MTPKNSNYCFIAGRTFYLRWYALNSEQGLKCAYLDHIITLHFTLHDCTFILYYPCYLLVTLLLPLRCRRLLLLQYPSQLFSTLSVIVTAPALKPHTTAVLFALIGASIRLSFITLNTILLSLLFNRVLWPEAAVCLPHICMHYGSV